MKRILLLTSFWLACINGFAVLRDNGVDSENLGKGDWIWQLPAAQSSVGAANAQGLMTFLKNKGVQWVTVKCGNGATIWTQFDAGLVTAAHQAGLKIFGWSYSIGDDIPGEINVAKRCLDLGADGFIINAESEFANNPNNRVNATNFCEGIRALYPNRFLAHAPFAYVSASSSYPYMTFGVYCDVVMPMAYWDDFYGITPQQMVTNLNTYWNNWHNSLVGADRNAIKPIVPIGQAYYNVTGTQITAFINALKSSPTPASPGGYQGVSFWSCQHHTTDHWSAIGAATMGMQLFPNAPTNLVAAPGGTTRIDLSWTDAATNETMFKIEQAVGTALNFTEIATVGANVTTFACTNLTPSLTYYFQVRAYNTNGDSPYSNIAGSATSNGAPSLDAIPDRTVNVLQTLSFSATATDVDPSTTNLMTDFETYAASATVMFQSPHYSGTTSFFIDTAATRSAVVSSTFPSGNAAAGGRVLKATWTFLASAANPWVRLTTFNMPILGNPVIDFDRQLQFDIYSDKALKVATGFRETGNPAGTPVGSNGGTVGGVEWVGVTGTVSGTPTATRTVAANTWTTLTFDPHQEPVRNFNGGNGVLATGLGTLEHLALVANGGNGPYNVYLDRFAVIRLNRLTYSLEPGAPAGASINATNGWFTWTPTAAQGPTNHTISVRVTDNGSPVLSDVKTFQVAVQRQTSALISALVLTNGQFRLQVPVDAGITYSIQSSTNLIDWQTILTTNASGSLFQFTDPLDLTFSRRFYRVLSP